MTTVVWATPDGDVQTYPAVPESLTAEDLSGLDGTLWILNSGETVQNMHPCVGPYHYVTIAVAYLEAWHLYVPADIMDRYGDPFLAFRRAYRELGKKVPRCRVIAEDYGRLPDFRMRDPINDKALASEYACFQD